MSAYYASNRAVGALFWLVFAILVFIIITNICQNNRISDLEDRMTTFETVQIEMVAPPSGGQQ